MEPEQITSLAKLLRDNGDKVLNSEFKLSLSGSMLRALNDSFTLIADRSELCAPLTFQVVNTNTIKYRDLQLIHDFVQKTLLLCITHFPGDEYFEGMIDISKFRCLNTLEIQKINIKQIIGIQPLRAQLKHLICTQKSLKSVEDIITYCGGDNSNGFVWNELKIADFSYNNLGRVDSSLEFAQWLQTLNLSHNRLISVEAIKWLPNLKILNLSFNRLTRIPNFHLEACKRLRVLILSNNFVEDLNGLSRLDALTELDLSDNCLLDHTYLLPLSTLIALNYLNLYGNPLHCHPNHRQSTAYYLHKNTASVKFILDSSPLSKNEKTLIGKYQSYQCLLTSRLPLSQGRSSGQATPQNRYSRSETPSSSVGSVSSLKINNSDLTNSTSNFMTSSTNEKQKKLRTRTVDLEENNSTLSKSKNRSAIEASTDHLETKKQIEDLRNKFGVKWFDSDHSHMVKSVIGLNEDKTNINKDAVHDYKLTSKHIMDDLLGQMNNLQNDLKIRNEENVNSSNSRSAMISSTPKKNQSQKDSPNKNNVQIYDGNIKKNSANETLYHSVVTDDESTNTIYKSTLDKEEEEVKKILNTIYSSTSDETEISEPEDNEYTYIVYGKDNNEFFLTVSESWIKEKEVLTRRTITKWSLKILQSCDRIKANTLRINFDTVKKDKKERVYTIEEGLCQELENYLRNILSNRLLSEMNQTVYRCVNCACQFSRENTYRTMLNVFCPECKSSYVVEVHETLPEVSSIPEHPELKQQEQQIRISSKTATENPVQNISSHSNPVSVAKITTTTSSLKHQQEQPIQNATTSKIAATSTNSKGADSEGRGSGQINQNSGEKYLIEKSSSQSSLGMDTRGMCRLPSNKKLNSAGSLNESSSCSKISNSQSSFDSNQSVAGSSTNERDLDLSNFEKNNCCESDIEILSNPSQSSIEVLDNAMMMMGHSSRKTSEERRILQILPVLETIEDNNSKNMWNSDVQLNDKDDVLGMVSVGETGKSYYDDHEVPTTKIIPPIAVTSTLALKTEDLDTGTGIESKLEGLDHYQNNQLSKKNSVNDSISGGSSNGGKKNIFSNVNLTESSSSGSVTDSVCTTYEQNDKGSILDVTSSSGYSSKELKSANTKILFDKDLRKDDSIISSMLGGIFQSTNILMSRIQKPIETNLSNEGAQCEKFKYNYEDFGETDHRLKLYFYQSKFDDNEHFKWLVKGKIVNETTGELFEGLIVMSTMKFYIMEIFSNENDDISKWLRQILNVKIDRIGVIQLLPWHIGLTFQIRNLGTFLLILQDISRTDSLLLFFANNPLPTNCKLEYQISDKVLKKLSDCTDSEKLKMFSILNKCEISTNNTAEKKFSSPIGLFTTDKHLYLTTSNLRWLSDNSDSNIELNVTQLMSNVLEADKLTSTRIQILFFDDTQNVTELWKCEFDTNENADSCLNAIGQSWEELFGVPLVSSNNDN